MTTAPPTAAIITATSLRLLSALSRVGEGWGRYSLRRFQPLDYASGFDFHSVLFVRPDLKYPKYVRRFILFLPKTDRALEWQSSKDQPPLLLMRRLVRQWDKALANTTGGYQHTLVIQDCYMGSSSAASDSWLYLYPHKPGCVGSPAIGANLYNTLHDRLGILTTQGTPYA